MNQKMKKAWQIFNIVLLSFGFLYIFYLANNEGLSYAIEYVCGFACGFLFAPAFHEIGHVAFADLFDMECVYVKIFCLEFKRINGKWNVSLISVFADDQTQVVPTRGGDMQKRAEGYTLGGLMFSGFILLCIFVAAMIFSVLGYTNYLLWGLIPYNAYLLLLNLAPVEYEGGKTDTLVYLGLKNGYDAEKNMLAAMEIQGQLYEGKSFSQIDESLYFEQPVLCEDEPLFAVMLDLRYRYYLEKGDMEQAAKTLNRFAQIEEYLSPQELEKIAAEFVYMHAINDNAALAEESAKGCGEYLNDTDSLTACRICAAFHKVKGEIEEAKLCIEQALDAMANERMAGVRKFEEILLSRI